MSFFEFKAIAAREKRALWKPLKRRKRIPLFWSILSLWFVAFVSLFSSSFSRCSPRHRFFFSLFPKHSHNRRTKSFGKKRTSSKPSSPLLLQFFVLSFSLVPRVYSERARLVLLLANKFSPRKEHQNPLPSILGFETLTRMASNVLLRI